MSLTTGTRLGPYEVVAPLGAGGMGEVYRATDTKLGREVAVKVLPAELAGDTERLARFEREAKLLASLNHTNIAHVYGFESATLDDGSSAHFLAMELVEGEELAERLKRAAIRVDEALAIARQIAEALEEAHEKGIVHRDLKPANVKLTPDGKVKVLDFGLAKAYAGEGGPGSTPDLSQSPTLANTGTQAGVILGTAAYMSPEQARGKPVDKRADIWGFGVVLYEMLSGHKLFEGETVSDVLAGVLKTDVDLGELPDATPFGVRQLLRRCLERNPKNRLHDIADARIVIDEASLAGGAEAAPMPGVRRGQGRLPWAIAATSVGVALAVFLLGQRALRRGADAAEILRLQWVLPKGERLFVNEEFGRGFAISRDGSKIVYAVEAGATSELRLRSLDSGISSVLPGTEGGSAPFFSPDGKWIGFAAGPKLKKVALAGGAPITLADAPAFRGAVWGEDGSIYFVPNVYVPISRMPSTGGVAQPITAIRTAEGEVQHRWPDLLPGGNVLLFVIGLGGEWDDATIVAQRLDSGERKVLVRGGTSPRYLPTGQLVYARAGGLYAVTLDPRSLEVTGPPVEVARNVFVSSLGWAAMDVSRTGLLVTVPGDSIAGASVLSWVDREGRGEPLKLPAASYSRVALSPAGDRVALGTGNVVSVLDLARLSLIRITVPRRAWNPIWAGDGRRIYFSYEQGKGYQVYSKAADDTGEPDPVGLEDASQDPVAVSHDGSRLLVLRWPADGQNALVFRAVNRPQGNPAVLFQSPHMHTGFADFSPDDRWIVYQTEESGRPEIYVRPANGEDRKWQVSIAGGTAPVWVGDEIFFLCGPKLLVAPVRANGGELVVGEPEVLFENHRVLAFDAARDGKRFLVAEDPNPGAQTRLDVVVHWFAEVQRKIAEARTP
jgi:Protein kinase domain/WD40-like Beta Propeller Repeat